MRKSDRKLRIQELESRLALDGSGASAAGSLLQFVSQEIQQGSQFLTSVVNAAGQEVGTLANLIHTDLSGNNLANDAVPIAQTATNAAAQVFKDGANFVSQLVSDAAPAVHSLLSELPQLTPPKNPGGPTVASQFVSDIEAAVQSVAPVVQKDISQLESTLQADISQAFSDLNAQLQQLLKDASHVDRPASDVSAEHGVGND